MPICVSLNRITTKDVLLDIPPFKKMLLCWINLILHDKLSKHLTFILTAIKTGLPSYSTLPT